jgi:hypothetical protein
MPVQRRSNAADTTAEKSPPKLTYRGGPVLQHVKVFTVFWGTDVAYSSGPQSINDFYKAVTDSAYFDWLGEYNTNNPAQQIGRGTLMGSFSYPQGAKGQIDDSQIAAALGQLIDAGSLPAPDADTLFAVHFAPGIDITQGGQVSCQAFCAYHNSFSHNGVNVYYSVVPDQGGSCTGGCGKDPDPFNNLTSVSSHELIEATTDADVGQGQLAWYDDANGEIGDICNAQQGTIAGYTVQKEWSNQQNACIVSSSGPPKETCAHDLCAPGDKLDPACDPCVQQLCAQDSYCCATTWDSRCLGEVSSICGRSCN